MRPMTPRGFSAWGIPTGPFAAHSANFVHTVNEGLPFRGAEDKADKCGSKWAKICCRIMSATAHCQTVGQWTDTIGPFDSGRP